MDGRELSTLKDEQLTIFRRRKIGFIFQNYGQVVLSIGIPFAIIPLMKYTHDRSLMGDYVDGPVKFAINMVVVSLIVTLNVILVILTLSGRS